MPFRFVFTAVMLGKETPGDEGTSQVSLERERTHFFMDFQFNVFQVQYHTFPTIEDSIFRQDPNSKGGEMINVVAGRDFISFHPQVVQSSSSPPRTPRQP